ncbi:MAG: hypothetical protein LBJ25_03030 [Candidatus Margulisbacteria bacterium]|jgi:hypothetical protein|nr:hypothetical protein [Candidatus Margulisiibacteriota bacterium]
MYLKNVAEDEHLREIFNTAIINQIAVVKKIAQEQGLYLSDFSLSEYGEKKFRQFIAILEKEIGHASAVVVAFALTDGAKDWLTVVNCLDVLELAKINCEIVIAKNPNKPKAKVVFEVLGRLNGRMTLADHNSILMGKRKEYIEKYDIKNRTFTGLCHRILTGATFDNSGYYKQADCKPLALLFYLVMSVLREHTELYLAWTKKDNEIGVHCFAVAGEEIKEPTTEYGVPGALHKNKFYSRKVDFWALLADSVGLQHDELLKEKSLEEIKNGVAQINTVLGYDPDNPYLYEVLAKHYKYLVVKEISRCKEYLEIAIKYSEKAQWFYENFNFPEAVKGKMRSIINDLSERLNKL